MNINSKSKGVNKIMENEKSVYEMRLEDKDKIIDFQQNIINKLIKTNIIITLILAVVMIVFTLSYFFSDYNCYNNTSISGDSNSVTSDNTLEDSEMNLDK